MKINIPILMLLAGLALVSFTVQADDSIVDALNPTVIIEGPAAAQHIAFDAAGTRLTIDYTDGSAALYTLADGETVTSDAVTIGPSGAVASADQTEILLNGQAFSEAPAPVRHLLVNAQSSRVAAALEDGSVLVYETGTGTSLTTLEASGDVLLFNAASDVLAVNNPALNQVILWQQDLSPIVLPGKAPVRFSPNGDFIALVNDEKTLTLRRMEDVLAREEDLIWHSLNAHYAAISDIAFAPNSRIVASASQDGTISLWDVESSLQIAVLMGHMGAVNALEFSPDGTLLASGDQLGVLKIWDVATGEILRSMNMTGPLLDVAFSGEMIATADAEGHVLLWSAGESIDIAVSGEPIMLSPVPALETGLHGKARRALAAGANPLHPVGCLINKDDPVLALGRSREGSVLLYSPQCEGAVWTSVGSHNFNWKDPLAVQNLPLLEAGLSSPRLRLVDYEQVCSAVQNNHISNVVESTRTEHALYPPENLPAEVQASLTTPFTTVICHEYETKPVENCHYFGRSGYSNIFTRQTLYDTIRLVDVVSGDVIAQRRFEGGVPPLCPKSATRGEVNGAAPAPQIWVPWVLENTDHANLLPLRSSLKGPEPIPLFTTPSSESFGTVEPKTIVNVVAYSGEGWLLLLLPDLSTAWVQSENVTASALVMAKNLPESTLAAVPNGPVSREQQIANFATYRPLGRISFPADSLAQSPDGFYVAGVQQGAGGAMLSLWDIRGGQHVWQVSLPQRQWETIRFSPTGETLLVKTNAPYPAEEEIRFTFYDTLTGEVLSETGDIDIIDSPIIPGNMPQGLMAEPFYTKDGQNLVVSYLRRTEAPRCAVWSPYTGQLIWQIDRTCGSINSEGRYMISPHPYTELFSAYDQLVVYEVSTGAVLNVSQDEVIRFAWLTDEYVFIERPYGEAPVLWNILEDNTAVMEMPFQMGSFTPKVLHDVIFYASGSQTYVWDMATGELVAKTLLQGNLVKQGKGIILLQEYRAEDSEESTLRALNLDNEEIIWEVPWHHSDLSLRADGLYAFAYDRLTSSIDIFDLQTGIIAGHIKIPYFDFLLTDDWGWIMQWGGGQSMTVWGTAESVGLFSDPPQIHITADTPAYFESNTNFPYNELVIRANQYLWASGRTAAGDWVEVEDSRGHYWLPTANAEFLVDMDLIPIR